MWTLFDLGNYISRDFVGQLIRVKAVWFSSCQWSFVNLQNPTIRPQWFQWRYWWFILVNHWDQAHGLQSNLQVLTVVCREAKAYSEIHVNEGNTSFLKERRSFMLLLSFATRIAVYNLSPVLFLISFVAMKIIQWWFCSSSKQWKLQLITEIEHFPASLLMW